MAANDLSNDRKASWASEVSEDEEATGWDEPQQVAAAGVSLPAYPEGPSKPRKKKKKQKKNKSNGNTVLAKQDSQGNTHLEADFQSLNVGSSQMPGHNTHATSQDLDGWQVASSRKARQVSLAYGSPPPMIQNPSLLSASPSPFNSLPARPGRIPPPQRFDNPGSYGVQRPAYTPIIGTNIVNGHGQGAAYGGADSAPPQWRAPDAALQRPRSFSDNSKPTLPPQNINQGERMNAKHMMNDTQAQTQARAWGKQIPVSVVNEVKKSEEKNDNILSQLLPSERAEVGVSKLGCASTSSQPVGSRKENKIAYPVPELDEVLRRADSDSALSDADLDDDSDWIGSDPGDSDESVKSLETRKQNKWFQPFFNTLDEFSNEQILEHDRQWHCPACHGGVGAIDWYRGLQPLLAHAKTHRTKRIGLHREFAKVLEEELEVRRAGTGSLGETKFGKWKGLQNADATKDLMIVWPPMVVIQNTQLDQDDQEKWIGMGNKELLDMFKQYNPSKARHSYGPQGHRGMSLLIFAESPTGYYHAERLAKEFLKAGKGREQWEKPSKIKFHPGGDRILYGYMATNDDMDIFNKHSSGKSKLKWDLKRYNEAVAEPLKQMDKDNQQLHYYKFKVQKQKEHSKILERSMSMFTRKLELREEEIAVIRQRARDQHEDNQREMDDLERTYKDSIIQLRKNIMKREQEIQEKQEEFQQEHIERCQQLEKKLSEEQQPKQAKVEEAIARQTEIVELSLRESEDYECNKRELLKQQHIRKVEFMRKQWEEALEFEKGLERERQELLDRYSNIVESAS